MTEPACPPLADSTQWTNWLRSHALEIEGPCRVRGHTLAPGGKWYAAHAFAAALIAPGAVCIRRAPESLDTAIWLELIGQTGARAWRDGDAVTIDPGGVWRAPDRARCAAIRASIELLAALAVRLPAFVLGYPGGDRIGARPIMTQLGVIEHFGGQVRCEPEGIRVLSPPRRRTGPRTLTLAKPQISVTVMATILAAGLNRPTRIENVPLEPEISYHCAFLRAIGVPLIHHRGGTPAQSWIDIHGSPRLDSMHADFVLAGDPAWAITHAAAALATQGELRISGVRAADFGASLTCLQGFGAETTVFTDAHGEGLLVRSARAASPLACITADYFPAVSTDHLPFFTALACTRGSARFADRLFEARDAHFVELAKMGACIESSDRSRRFAVRHRLRLQARTDLVARDIRAGMALAVAAMTADGISRITGLEHIARGYPRVAETLRMIGVNARLAPRGAPGDA